MVSDLSTNPLEGSILLHSACLWADKELQRKKGMPSPEKRTLRVYAAMALAGKAFLRMTLVFD